MVLHLSAQNGGAAVVLTFDFELLAVLLDVLIHIIVRKHDSALEDAAYGPEWRFLLAF